MGSVGCPSPSLSLPGATALSPSCDLLETLAFKQLYFHFSSFHYAVKNQAGFEGGAKGAADLAYFFLETEASVRPLLPNPEKLAHCIL